MSINTKKSIASSLAEPNFVMRFSVTKKKHEKFNFQLILINESQLNIPKEVFKIICKRMTHSRELPIFCREPCRHFSSYFFTFLESFDVNTFIYTNDIPATLRTYRWN